MHAPIKALADMLANSSRKPRVTASPEMMEYGKQLAKEFWEAKDKQRKGLRLVDEMQSEHQADFDDAKNDQEWTR